MDVICVVTGGRDYPWSWRDDELLQALLVFHGATELWHGGAIGVDTQAGELAKRLGLSVRVFLPEPVLLPSELPRALMDRNTKMVDWLVAAIRHDAARGFAVAFPGQEGTKDAADKLLRRRIHLVDLRASASGP